MLARSLIEPMLCIFFLHSLVSFAGTLMDVKCNLSSAVDPLATSLSVAMGPLSATATKKPKAFGNLLFESSLFELLACESVQSCIVPLSD